MFFWIMVIIILCAAAEANPKVFGFVPAILSGIWNVISTVGMFFVEILRKFFSIFTFIGNIFEWLIDKLGHLLAPVMEIIPDSPIIPFVLLLLLGVCFISLIQSCKEPSKSEADEIVKWMFGWCCTAFNLGIIVAGCKNPLIWMSGAFDAYVIDTPMTLLNYADWTGYARTMLSLTLIGGLMATLHFAFNKGMKAVLRTWVGLAFCGVLGCCYMNARLAVTDWLADNLGFIGKLLNIPVGLFEFGLLIMVFFGVLAFLLPQEAIAALVGIGETSSGQRASGTPAGNDEDSFVTDSYPTYVTDDEGNNYSVSIDGDFLYINLPSGRASTKWEYVKGSSYFHVNGKRFYPHS